MGGQVFDAIVKNPGKRSELAEFGPNGEPRAVDHAPFGHNAPTHDGTRRNQS